MSVQAAHIAINKLFSAPPSFCSQIKTAYPLVDSLTVDKVELGEEMPVSSIG